MKLSESLSEIQKLVETVESLQEAGEEIPDTLVPEIQTSVEHFKASIDKRVATIEGLDNYIKFVESQAKTLTAKAKVLKNLLERIKQTTLWQIETNPDLDWRGSLRKLARQKSPPTKTWILQTEDIKHAIPPTAVDLIDERYYTKKEVYILDRATVEADLKAGRKVDNICHLNEPKYHLRIR